MANEDRRVVADALRRAVKITIEVFGGPCWLAWGRPAGAVARRGTARPSMRAVQGCDRRRARRSCSRLATQILLAPVTGGKRKRANDGHGSGAGDGPRRDWPRARG